MIADFGLVISEYARNFTKITYSKFTSGGITYNGVQTQSTIAGVMQPISTEDRELILSVGYTLQGKVTFYVSGSETLLTENDTIVDSTNIEWVVLPYDKGGITDWREHGNYVKYILSRKILSES